MFSESLPGLFVGSSLSSPAAAIWSEVGALPFSDPSFNCKLPPNFSQQLTWINAFCKVSKSLISLPRLFGDRSLSLPVQFRLQQRKMASAHVRTTAGSPSESSCTLRHLPGTCPE